MAGAGLTSEPDGAESVPGGVVAWKRHQLELLTWFRAEAPSLAQPYEAAVRLMVDSAFPARVHLVCHIVRDIYSQLPAVLDAEYRRREANEISGALDALVPVWEPLLTERIVGGGGAGGRAERAGTVEVPVIAVRRLGEVLSLRRRIKDQPTSAQALARALYRRFVEAGHAPPARLVKAFNAERAWFVGRAHLVRDAARVPRDDGLSEHFDAFERSLHSLVAPHFTVQQELDDILQQANT